MHYQLLPVAEQTIVITGAASGIGLVTATRAAARGARVVLAARTDHDLRKACDEIRNAAGRAIFVVADVSNPKDVERIADAAVAQFGRIDTWVNNAAVSMAGPLMDLRLEDMRRQMDVSFWGQVYGSREAVLRMRRHGGALINVASAPDHRAIPFPGIDRAAEHAVKAFTDTLRMELEAEGVPISVSLVTPARMDTPFFERAAADAVLRCAGKPTPEIAPTRGGIGGMRPAATVAGLVALMVGAVAVANRVSPFE
jgi:NAD(P)-dependent dehydrogenase (short-subunit alcohol dehydrogenase family)